MLKHTAKPYRTRQQRCHRSVTGSASWLMLPVLSSVAFAVSLVGTAPTSWAQDEPPEFSNLRALIEINATDGDAGFQVEIDGDDWKQVTLRDPNSKRIYEVKGRRSVGDQGLTENFFESAEPSCDEVALDVVLSRFPEGLYEFAGRTTENEKFEGEAILTHALPAVPVNLDFANDSSMRISWEWPGDSPGLGNCPFTGHPGGAPQILQDEGDLFGFQVVVAREEPDPLVEFVVELAPTERDVVIPDNFIEPNKTYNGK